MKTLLDIAKKFETKEFNEENFCVGGGLSQNKFASNRHEDAKNDQGKETFGKVVTIFKKVTGMTTEEIKEILWFAFPNPEWHHAGKLPKQYGGGMKKTYFLNASEIAHLAKNWDKILEDFMAYCLKQQEFKANEQTLLERQNDFLKANAIYRNRIAECPKYFLEVDREMNGKNGWFSSVGKRYNLPEYYTGWEFSTIELKNQYYSII